MTHPSASFHVPFLGAWTVSFRVESYQPHITPHPGNPGPLWRSLSPDPPKCGLHLADAPPTPIKLYSLWCKLLPSSIFFCPGDKRHESSIAPRGSCTPSTNSRVSRAPSFQLYYHCDATLNLAFRLGLISRNRDGPPKRTRSLS